MIFCRQIDRKIYLGHRDLSKVGQTPHLSLATPEHPMFYDGIHRATHHALNWPVPFILYVKDQPSKFSSQFTPLSQSSQVWSWWKDAAQLLVECLFSRPSTKNG